MTLIEGAKAMRPRLAVKPPRPPAPLIDTSQSSPGVAAIADVVNNAAAPFQAGPDPKKGTLGQIEHGIGMVMGVVGAPFELLDTGFALVTAPLAALMPGIPAATLTAPHLGMPHAHTHPPSLIPPAPPVPLPSVGMVMCAGCVSVLIGGIPAARAGDVGLAPTCGSLSPAFEIYTGSSNTWIGGSRAARMLDITRHCNPASAMGKLGAAMGAVGVVAGAVGAGASATAGEALQASMQAAQAAADAAALAMSALLGKDPGIPPAIGAVMLGNPTVLIGGFPLPDLLDVLGGALKGLRKLGDAAGKTPAVKKALAKVGLCNDPGEPVNPFRGVVYHDSIDFEAPSGFTWQRHYRSDWNDVDGPLGYGFRHFYERRLTLLRKRALYESHDGEQVSIPRHELGGFVVGAGFTLTEHTNGRYSLSTDRGELLEFYADPTDPTSARLARYGKRGVSVHLSYDKAGRLTTLTELLDGSVIDVRLVYDSEGHLAEVWRGPRGGAPVVISRYAYEGGCLARWEDALGAAARMRYDAARRIIQGTDRRGYSFHWHYDPSTGRCIESHGDDGLWGIEARYEGNQSVFWEADGGEWTFKHHADGVISHILDPLGGVLEYVRDDETGRIVKQVTPGGLEITWLYDASGKHYAREDQFGQLLPPEDREPNPADPLAHDGPTTAREFLSGRPLLRLMPSRNMLPSAIHQRLRALTPESVTSPAMPSSERDLAGRVVARVEADGSVRRFQRDAEGNVTAERISEQPWMVRKFQSWNLLAAQTSPLGSVTRYEHTHRGKIRALTDANGNRTEYVRDQRHRIREIHRLGQVFRRYAHDAFDSIIEERDANGATLVAYETGKHGLRTSAALASGERYSYEYDSKGRLKNASSTLHQIVQRHIGRRRELDQRDGKGVEHFYGSELRLQQTRTLEKFRVRYHYANHSRAAVLTAPAVVRVTTPDGAVHSFWHQDRLVVRDNGNGTSEARLFDGGDRLCARLCWRRERPWHGAFWSTQYRYDASGCLVSIVDSDDGPELIEYDADHRLIAQHGKAGELRYAYDPAGNITQTPRHPELEYEAGNCLTRAGFDHYSHDERLRRSTHDRRGGPITRYRYDSQGRLIEVSWDDRPEVWRAAYDGLGRRLWREYGGRRTDFYWDGDRLGAEVDPEGRLRIYVYPNEDALVPFMWLDYESVDQAPEAGRAFYLFTSPTGVPLRVEDALANEVWRARAVDPYAALDEASSRTCPVRLRFAGHFLDEHLGLFYNRFRDYDPAVGRYLQPDPIGHAGGTNLFAYPANPLVDVDLRGLIHKAKDAPDPNPKPKDDGPSEAAPEGKKSKSDNPLDDMDDAALQEHCRAKAKILNDALVEQYPNNPDTLSVGVLEGPNGRRTVVTTSADSQKLPDGVAAVAAREGIEPMPTQPLLGRSEPRPNPNYDEAKAQARKDAGLKPDTRNNPKTITDSVIIDPETGERKPYTKADGGHPPEGTIHHAEQRMERGAADNGEKVLAQKPNRKCCDGCVNKLGDKISKIPDPDKGV